MSLPCITFYHLIIAVTSMIFARAATMYRVALCKLEVVWHLHTIASVQDICSASFMTSSSDVGDPTYKDFYLNCYL